MAQKYKCVHSNRIATIIAPPLIAAQFMVTTNMDLIRKERMCATDSPTSTSKRLSLYQKKSNCCIGEIKMTEKKVSQYNNVNILEGLFKRVGQNSSSEKIEVFVSYGKGLYSMCQQFENQQTSTTNWKCLAGADDLVYKHIMREKLREDCYTTLGIGKEVEEMPAFVQKKIFNKMRPKTSSIATQAKVVMAELGSQTYCSSIQNTDAAVQASTDTKDFCVQTSTSTEDCGVQASTSTEECGVQASTSTDDCGVQASTSTEDCGVQASTSTEDCGVQASTSTEDCGIQVRPAQTTTGCQVQTSLQETAIQTTPTEQEAAGNVTLQVNMTRDGRIGDCTSDGESLQLNKEDSDIILNILRKNMAKKAHASSYAVGTTLGHDKIEESVTTAPPPKKPKVSYKKHRPTAPKTEVKDIQRFHRRLPENTSDDKYLSKSSPFSYFGYIAHKIPSKMMEVKIPVVDRDNVTLSRQESGAFDILGHGSYGFVYLAVHKKDSKASICVKDYDMDMSTLHDVYHEAQILLYLESTKYVPRCLGLMESPLTPVPGVLSLVQECFAGGCTLKNLLDNPPTTFGMWSWVCIVYQLFHGLNQFHEKHVMMNDIKLDNVLVDVEADELNNIRFIDLGLASYRCGRKFSSNEKYMEQFFHVAPEVRKGMFSTPASDIYSVGVIALQIGEAMEITELDQIVEVSTHENPLKREICEDILRRLEKMLYL